MRFHKAVIGLLVVLALAGAVCGTDAQTKVLVKNVSDGEILIFDDGSVYEVLPGDNIVASLWLGMSECLIIDRSARYKGRIIEWYEIVNLDDKEKVGARRLR